MELRDAAAYHALLLNVERASEETTRNYLHYWQRLIDYVESNGLDARVENFSPQLVRDAALWYRERATGRRGGVVAVRQFVERMNTIGKMLMREKIIGKTAYESVRLPRVEKQLRDPFSKTEVSAMWAAAQSSRNPERAEALLLLLLDTGMRIGEAATLTINNLDLVNRQLRVSDEGKGRRERLVPFGDSSRTGGRTVQALRRYLAVRRGSAFDKGRVFLSHDGFGMTPTGLSDVIQSLGRAAGVDNPIPHRLRHTFCTWYLTAHPGDELGLRAVVGHLSKEVLADYVHFSTAALRERVGRSSLSDIWLGSRAG